MIYKVIKKWFHTAAQTKYYTEKIRISLWLWNSKQRKTFSYGTCFCNDVTLAKLTKLLFGYSRSFYLCPPFTVYMPSLWISIFRIVSHPFLQVRYLWFWLSVFNWNIWFKPNHGLSRIACRAIGLQ